MGRSRGRLFPPRPDLSGREGNRRGGRETEQPGSGGGRKRESSRAERLRGTAVRHTARQRRQPAIESATRRAMTVLAGERARRRSAAARRDTAHRWVSTARQSLQGSPACGLRLRRCQWVRSAGPVGQRAREPCGACTPLHDDSLARTRSTPVPPAGHGRRGGADADGRRSTLSRAAAPVLLYGPLYEHPLQRHNSRIPNSCKEN